MNSPSGFASAAPTAHRMRGSLTPARLVAIVNHALSPSDRRRMYSRYPRRSRSSASTPRRVTSARTKPRMGCDASSPSSFSEASARTFQLIVFRRRFIILPMTLPGGNCSCPGACATRRTPFCPFATIASATRARRRPEGERGAGRSAEAPGARAERAANEEAMPRGTRGGGDERERERRARGDVWIATESRERRRFRN